MARYETQLFQEQLMEIRKADRRAADQIDTVLDRIVANPQAHDGQLKGSLVGQFKKKAVDRKYRIIFSSCRYCLSTRKEKCADCADRPDDSVILRQVFLRREI